MAMATRPDLEPDTGPAASAWRDACDRATDAERRRARSGHSDAEWVYGEQQRAKQASRKRCIAAFTRGDTMCGYSLCSGCGWAK